MEECGSSCEFASFEKRGQSTTHAVSSTWPPCVPLQKEAEISFRRLPAYTRGTRGDPTPLFFIHRQIFQLKTKHSTAELVFLVLRRTTQQQLVYIVCSPTTSD